MASKTKTKTMWQQIQELQKSNGGKTETVADIEARYAAQAEERKQKREAERAAKSSSEGSEEEKELSEQDTLAKIQKTKEESQAIMDNIANSLDAINKTEDNFQALKDNFDHAMQSALTGRGGAAHHYDEPIEELQQIYGVPQECSISEIAA